MRFQFFVTFHNPFRCKQMKWLLNNVSWVVKLCNQSLAGIFLNFEGVVGSSQTYFKPQEEFMSLEIAFLSVNCRKLIDFTTKFAVSNRFSLLKVNFCGIMQEVYCSSLIQAFQWFFQSNKGFFRIYRRFSIENFFKI